MKVGISKVGVFILVEFAVAIRLEVRWRHGGRKAASVRKAVKCALRFGRRSFGESKAVGMPIILTIPISQARRTSRCFNQHSYPNAVTLTWKP